MLRGYECHVYKERQDGDVVKGGTACFSYVVSLFAEKIKHIYIDTHFAVNEKDLKLLVYIINKITPCSIVVHEKIQTDFPVIKFNLLYGTYKQNLLLLNFIRYLWNEPAYHFQEEFFKRLRDFKTIKDPMLRLTTANQTSVNDKSSDQSCGHCNIVENVRTVTLKEFMESNIKDIQVFLAPKK